MRLEGGTAGFLAFFFCVERVLLAITTGFSFFFGLLIRFAGVGVVFFELITALPAFAFALPSTPADVLVGNCTRLTS